MTGTVEKITKSLFPNEPDKAQINVIGADRLYRQIRIDNILTKGNGEKVNLKPGANVEVTFEADPKDTVLINSASSLSPLRVLPAPPDRVGTEGTHGEIALFQRSDR